MSFPSRRPETQRFYFTLLSFVASVVIFAIKYAAFRLTHSAAIESDALENIVNCVAALFALGAVVWAAKPADAEHPYGHGKIEFFSGAFEGGLIALAALLILYEATLAALHGAELHRLDLGLGLSAIAGALNGVLGLVLLRAGTQLHSPAIEADGRHVLSDFHTTIGVLIGVGITYATGLAWLDTVVAFAVGLWLAWNGIHLVRDSARALLDSEDPKLIEQVVAKLNATRPADIIAVHGLRAIRSGGYVHVDIHIVVPEFYPVAQGHELIEGYAHRLFRELPHEGELHTHMDPCERRYCENCEVSPCPIRRAPFSARKVFTVAMAKSPIPDEGEGHA